MEESHKLNLKGIWIPGEVAFNNRLSATDKLVFWLISSLDQSDQHCFASNAYLSTILNLSTSTISNSIATLSLNGYLISTHYEGGGREIQVDLEYVQRYQYLITDFNNWADRSEKIKTPPSEKIKTNIKDSLLEIFPKGKRGEPPQTPLLKYSADARDIFQFWNSLGKPLSKMQEKATIALSEAMEAIERNLRRGYSKDEIAEGMVRYFNLVENGNSIIRPEMPGGIVSLQEFFGFKDFTKQRMKEKDPHYKIQSWFEECMKGQKHLNEKYGKYINDEFPIITEVLMDEWCASNFKNGSFSTRDENNFRKAAKMLAEYLKKNESKLLLEDREFRNPQYCAKYMIKALEFINAKEPTTGWLCNELMFTKNLPSYFKHHGMLS
jgi:hypothetical protein